MEKIILMVELEVDGELNSTNPGEDVDGNIIKECTF